MNDEFDRYLRDTVPAATNKPAADLPSRDVEIARAGASLRREAERRSAAARAAVLARHPILWRLLTPGAAGRAAAAFDLGATGEQRAVARIAAALGDRVPILTNRGLGAGFRRGDLDLLVITTAAVWILDVKHYPGADIAVHRRRGTLTVRGTDRGTFLIGLGRQAAAVRQALADGPVPELPVRTALCFVGASLPLLSRRSVAGVSVWTPRQAVRGLRRSRGPLTGEQVEAVHRHLHRTLPPAR